MFAGGTNKKDKKIFNSVFNMNHIFDDNNNQQISNNNNNIIKNINLSSKNNNSLINISSNSNSSHLNNSQNNNENVFFDFENIEMPIEEDYGDFRVISNSDTEKSKSSNSNPSVKLKSQKNDVKIDLINLIIINKAFKSKNNLPNIKSYIASIYYNKISTKNKFNIDSFKSPCYIYDSIINEIIDDLDINYSNNGFLYMSYRSGFENLNNIGCGNYTSDCGWDCMLRCCQMMLSRGIIKNEIYKLYNNKGIVKKTDIINIIKYVLYLFNDKYIPFKELKKNIFLKNIYEKYKANKNKYELIPPYSIHTLCKLSKCSGVYTSDMKIIKCFIEINEQIFNNNFGIVHFENGIISKKKLLETFCIKKNLENNENEDEKKNLIINPITNIEELNNMQNYDKNDPMGAINIFDYYGEEYKFMKSGFIFISLRLGLRDLDEYYFELIPLLFQKFHNNIGFVSGKKNKAFYFIGFNGDNKLIYADPHLNQKAENHDISSFEVKNLYLLDIKELSSSITIGININNSTDLKILIYELQWFNKKYENIMNFK